MKRKKGAKRTKSDDRRKHQEALKRLDRKKNKHRRQDGE